MTIERELVFDFIALFRGNESAFGQFHYNPRTMEKKTGSTVQGQPAYSHWETHLTGTKPIIMGGIPIRDDANCYFGAIDFDDHEVDLIELEERVRSFKLPCIVCRSRRGGAHLYTFFEEPVKAGPFILKMKEWLGLLQLRNPDGRAIEIFPKQDKLDKKRKNRKGVEEPAIGNWINLPYHADGRDQYAIHEGEKLSLPEFIKFAEKRRMTASMFKGFFPTFESEVFADGPPCCAIIHEMGPEAGEKGNNYLFNVAVFLKANHPDEWQDMLEEYNETQLDEPLKNRELAEMIRQHEKTDYSYMCKQMPIAAHCYKTLCKKKKFGVGHVGKALVGASIALPELTKLTKIKTDPPKWIVEVNGEEVVMTTQDLLNMQKFQQCVLEQADMVFPILKRDTWQGIVNDLLADKRVIDAPEDAGVAGQFKTYVQMFLCQYRRSEGEEGLLKGFPVKIENRLYFRAVDLHKYLKKEHGFTEYPPNKMWIGLRKLGAEYDDRFHVCGKSFPVWHIAFEFANEQTEKFKQERKGARAQF